MKTHKQHSAAITQGALIAKLKDEDTNYAKISKVITIFYGIMIPIYAILIIRHYMDDASVTSLIGSFCFLLAMLFFLIVFKSFYKEYNTVDYTLPTLEMLKKAVVRYTPFHSKKILLFLAVLLIDVGISLNSSLDFDFLWVQVVFLGAIGISLLIGYYRWRIRYQPLRNAALAFIKELEEEDTAVV